MEAFFERLTVRAATIDELLSDDFEPLPGQKTDADRAGRRLAAWCRSCANGDWQLFVRRLERDGLTITNVLTNSLRSAATLPRRRRRGWTMRFGSRPRSATLENVRTQLYGRRASGHTRSKRFCRTCRASREAALVGNSTARFEEFE